MFGKKLITQRKLKRKTGTEGPREDPYSFTEWSLMVGKRAPIKFHMGLGDRLYVGERELKPPRKLSWKERDVWYISKWEQLTGLPVHKLDKVYFRIHPYFEDPMGRLEDYE
jgi:hypothetical protein